MLYSDYSFPSPNYSGTLATSPPCRIHALSFSRRKQAWKE